MTEQRLFREQGKRLRDFRESLDLTQDKFVENIARGRTRYIDWEKGRKLVPDDILKVFQNVYGLNPDWYKTGKGPQIIHDLPGHAEFDIQGKGEISGGYAPGEEPPPSNNHEKIKHLRTQVAETIRKTNTHTGIRVWAYAGAGNPFNADPEESEPMEVIHLESLVSPRYRDCFRVTGISMAPVIRDKALVFCDFNDKVLKTGAIYALNIPGEGLVVKEIRSEKKEGEPLDKVQYILGHKNILTTRIYIHSSEDSQKAALALDNL